MTVADIVAAASEVFGVSERDILGPDRTAHFVRARQACFLVAHETVGLSMPVIGRLMNRDHTTVSFGVRRAQALAKADPDYAEEVQRLTRVAGAPVFLRGARPVFRTSRRVAG